MKKARILLGDDHPVFAQGSRTNLEERYEIVGIAVDGRALVEAALSLNPDLILLDISMPLLSGIEAARRIKASLPEVKLLFFTMHSEAAYVQAAFESGAGGYLLKSATPEELLSAVQEVLRGHIYISSSLSRHWGHLRNPNQFAQLSSAQPARTRGSPTYRGRPVRQRNRYPSKHFCQNGCIPQGEYQAKARSKNHCRVNPGCNRQRRPLA